jgi:rare lipoprotein A
MRFVFALPPRARIGGAFALASVLCGCASGPAPHAARAKAPAEARAPSPDADGPGANPPADLANLADAEPRVEPIRPGGANKPYQALGRSFVPETRDVTFSERGLASWYGRKFHGKRTASGEVYDMYAMTAAHPTLPIPSYARVRNPANGREALVRINDRGPFVGGRIVDLSYAAAFKLDLLRGVAPVELDRITSTRSAPAPGAAAAPTASPRQARRPRRRPRPMAVARRRRSRSMYRSRTSRSRRRQPPSPRPRRTRLRHQTQLTCRPSGHRSLAARRLLGLLPPAPRPLPRLAPLSPAWICAPASAARLPRRRAASGFSSVASASATAPRAFAAASAADGEANWLEPLLAIFGDAVVYRVQAGPYPSRDEAESVAQRARAALAIVPLVVERQ